MKKKESGGAVKKPETGSGISSRAGEDCAERCPEIVIENVTPEIDGGRFAVKCIAGERVTVEADIFKDGHDVIGACILYQKKGDAQWREAPMAFLDNDRWRGDFTPEDNARYLYTIEAWMDVLATWCKNTEKKCPAQPSVKSDWLEGIGFFEKVKDLAGEEDRLKADQAIRILKRTEGESKAMLLFLQDPLVKKLVGKYPLKERRTLYDRRLELTVDRRLAEFGAWYEFFPRSQGKDPRKSATFKDCAARLPEIKKMGFDVLYLTPIHPIGRTNRKGPNNSLVADPASPGSPWAIGGPEGGHKAVHPDLGTLSDFRDFVKAAAKSGIEIALDIAYQCSPDHPYVGEHPEWFYRLPDGHIRYAENPPKKYEDIYPLNFHCERQKALWEEMKDILIFWIRQGVKIFRIDNPHTKPLYFWKWLIDGVQNEYPEVIFFAEAFTRPKMMKFLAKAGFTQSYTYFTWRNAKWELRQYLEELTQTPMRDYYRGNFFANTPDILHEFLQKGGRPAFQIRLVLAATLASSYGIYSGFELCENRPKAAGSEEYLDSEKYQYKVWDWDRPGNIKDFVARVNKIRNENPALAQYKNLEFYHSQNDQILCYGKRTADNGNVIVVVVNLDPFRAHEDTISLPLEKFGIDGGRPYQVKDLLNGGQYTWSGASNYVRLDPKVTPAHIFLINPA